MKRLFLFHCQKCKRRWYWVRRRDKPQNPKQRLYKDCPRCETGESASEPTGPPLNDPVLNLIQLLIRSTKR